MSTMPFTFQPSGHEFAFKKKVYEASVGIRTAHEAPKCSQDLSLDFLSNYFHLRINDVAKKLGICATVLKKICRKNGIPRWPHRRIKSFDKRIELAQLALSSASTSSNAEERERLLQELAECQRQRDLLLKNPGLISKSLSRRSLASNSAHQFQSSFDSSDEDTSDEDSDHCNGNTNLKAGPTNTSSHARRTLRASKPLGKSDRMGFGTTSPVLGSSTPTPASASPLPQSSSGLSLCSLGSSGSLSSAHSNVSMPLPTNRAAPLSSNTGANTTPLRKRAFAQAFEPTQPCLCCPNNAPAAIRVAHFAPYEPLPAPVFAPAPSAVPLAVAATHGPSNPLDAEAARTLQPLLDVISLAIFADGPLAPRA